VSIGGPGPRAGVLDEQRVRVRSGQAAKLLACERIWRRHAADGWLERPAVVEQAEPKLSADRGGDASIFEQDIDLGERCRCRLGGVRDDIESRLQAGQHRRQRGPARGFERRPSLAVEADEVQHIEDESVLTRQLPEASTRRRSRRPARRERRLAKLPWSTVRNAHGAEREHRQPHDQVQP
jgi:hypothetical protein